MVSNSLLLHLVLAFAVGSVWVTLVTRKAEKPGKAEKASSALAGFLGGLPSTSAFSFLFIGLNQYPTIASQATTVFPLAFSSTFVFLLSYAFFAQKGFRVGMIISLSIWFTVAGLIAVSGFKNYALFLIGVIPISLVIYYIFTEKLKLENITRPPTSATIPQRVGECQADERWVVQTVPLF